MGYYPGIEAIRSLQASDAARRANAETAKAKAEEALRRQAQEADVEDAQWREVPTQQLTAPDT